VTAPSTFRRGSSPNAAAASPCSNPPASAVGAGARQPVHIVNFSDAEVADSAELERLLGGTAVISPSNIPDWRGHRTDGHRFTDRQRNALFYAGLHPDTVDTVQVASAVGRDEIHQGYAARHKLRLIFACPIVRRGGNGKLLVISPGGLNKWVYADGSITKVRPR
jgi:hypothetical protein